MAVVDLFAAAQAGGDSTVFACNGVTRKLVGLYGDGGVTLSERVGAKVQVNTPDGYVDYVDEGKMVTLTQAKPVYNIKEAGSYRVSKPVTVQLVGVFTDDGT